jgi:dTDP-4-amino-4,6-dideoxygalactose transaminase
MHPRGRIDIGWTDLASGMAGCIRGGSGGAARERLERFWSPEGEGFACLSVRTGFDLLLQALALPRGSEVLVSALTIRDMTRIIDEHGLVAVPVDLDMETLSVPVDRLAALVTDRTRMILIAHVWGSRMPLDAVARFARERGLLLVEDCAQAYAGNDYRGHPDAGVSMFSFGTIKTNTALGGALLRVADRKLLGRLKAIEAGYPVQPVSGYLRRIVKYSALQALSHPVAFGYFARGCRLAGRNHDAIISHALRGFPGPKLLANIRRRPSVPLLRLMERRLRRDCTDRIARRVAASRQLLALLPGIPVPGMRAAVQTYWTFPIRSRDPEKLMRRLWQEGFDATRGASSLAVVEAPPGRPEAEPVQTRAWMRDLLYLPVTPGMSCRSLQELARAVRAFECDGPVAREPAPVILGASR